MESKAKLLGKYINKKRKAKKMTLQVMSNLSMVSVSHLSRIENGIDSAGKDIAPSLDAIANIASALELNLTDVLIDSGYIASQDVVDYPIEKALQDILEREELQSVYPIELNKLNSKEKDEIYKILLGTLEYISLKYKQK